MFEEEMTILFVLNGKSGFSVGNGVGTDWKTEEVCD